MITVRSIPLPRDGRVRAMTRQRPAGARVLEAGLDELTARYEEQRVAELVAAASARARAEALDSACAALAEASDRLDAARERAESALPSDAVHIGVEIARQILKIEIAAGNYDLERIVRATLAASEIKRGRCVVHLHPDDAKTIESVSFRGETEIHPDPGVPAGTVHLETPRGLLVREPEAALEEIREQLLEDLI